MADKVLIFIEDRVIKGIVLKVLCEKNLEFIEGLDEKDLQLKLDIFQDTIFFHIIQIRKTTHEAQFAFVRNIKEVQGYSNFPVMALIPDDTSEYVGGANKAGIEDVLLLPDKRELFRALFAARLNDFIKKIPLKEQRTSQPGLSGNTTERALSTDEDIKLEVKRAGRGKYAISFVMGRFSGLHIGQIQSFYEKLKKEMRDTDKIIQYDYHTFIVACPFTEKSYLVEVEKKIRESYEAMFGSYSRARRLDMYGATYPEDGKYIDRLVEMMEKGVHDSIVISNIREPLNTISRERLEEYKKMLKLYK